MASAQVHKILTFAFSSVGQRTVQTLEGSYTMAPSRCTQYRIMPQLVDADPSIRYGLLLPPASSHVNAHMGETYEVVIALAGGGHTRTGWEDFAAQVWERTVPCAPHHREVTALFGQQADGDVDLPELSSCTSPRWAIVGAIAPSGVSFNTRVGCRLLRSLADHVRTSLNATVPRVHLAGTSSGGIAALSCAVRSPGFFASVTALPGYVDFWGDADGDEMRAAARSALTILPLRVYVGERDAHFRAKAEEQFTASGEREVLLPPERLDDVGGIVRIVAGAAHNILPRLKPFELCGWLDLLAAVRAEL